MTTKGLDLFGLLLVGGESKRFGSEKRLAKFHSIPQEEYLRQLLLSFCDRVFISCRSNQQINSAYDSIVDKFSDKGPLNGVLSAFRSYPDVAWLVVAVDLPFINKRLLNFLISNRNPSATATCFYDTQGKLPEPLISIWETSAYSKLTTYYNGGGRSPREFLIHHNAHLLKVPNPSDLLGFNTMEDFEILKRNQQND